LQPVSSQASPGNLVLNSARVLPTTNKNKFIDSKMSSLRADQDSTAASLNVGNARFPMTPDEAFKAFS